MHWVLLHWNLRCCERNIWASGAEVTMTHGLSVVSDWSVRDLDIRSDGDGTELADERQ